MLKKNLSIIKINLLKNIKTQKASNLNLFNGKGRYNKRSGKFEKRDWYEVLLTIPKSITGKTVYPKGSFTVYTLDGFTIKMKTSGDFYKNFGSENDQKLFGKWIKGKLEKSKALKKGQLVNEVTFNKYGNYFLTLTRLKPKHYIMHF